MVEKITRRILVYRLKRLKKLKRFSNGVFNFSGSEISYPDAVGFAYAFHEIFVNKLLDFSADSKNPLIIDVGANVGLVTLFFKKKYPSSRILSIEADPRIFSFLAKNLLESGLKEVTAVNAAAWKSKGEEMDFFSDGSDGGSLLAGSNVSKGVKVKTIRLSEYINEAVDLLKIDIEGSEYVVMQEISAKLHLVKRLYVEFHSYLNSEQYLSEIIEILKAAGFRYHLEQYYPNTQRPFMGLHSFQGIHQMIGIYAWR
jgi:FkbM family methyltransferase